MGRDFLIHDAVFDGPNFFKGFGKCFENFFPGHFWGFLGIIVGRQLPHIFDKIF